MDSKELVNKLLGHYRPEILAGMMQKSLGTINLWKKGTRQPDIANFEKMQLIAKELNGKLKH